MNPFRQLIEVLHEGTDRPDLLSSALAHLAMLRNKAFLDEQLLTGFRLYEGGYIPPYLFRFYAADHRFRVVAWIEVWRKGGEYYDPDRYVWKDNAGRLWTPARIGYNSIAMDSMQGRNCILAVRNYLKGVDGKICTRELKDEIVHMVGELMLVTRRKMMADRLTGKWPLPA